MQTVYLELEKDEFYCPFTGQLLMDENIETFVPSPALAFFYIDEVGEMIYANNAMQDLWIKTEATIDAMDEALGVPSTYELLEENLNKAEETDHLVCFYVTTSGIACGPVNSTGIYCFDMNYMENKTEQ